MKKDRYILKIMFKQSQIGQLIRVWDAMYWFNDLQECEHLALSVLDDTVKEMIIVDTKLQTRVKELR